MLYLKAYCKQREQDDFLFRVVRPVVSQALTNGEFTNWFFVRYVDPKPHIRLRFIGPKSAVLGSPRRQLIHEIGTGLQLYGASKLVVDRYRPETKRYGGRLGVRIAEKSFGISSRVVLDHLAVDRNIAPRSKIEFAWASGEVVLLAFGLSLLKRGRIFSGDNVTGIAVSPAMASLVSNVQTIVRSPLEYYSDRSPRLAAILSEMYRDLRPLHRKLDILSRKNGVPVESIANDLIHMHLNRLGYSWYEEQAVRFIRRQAACL